MFKSSYFTVTFRPPPPFPNGFAHNSTNLSLPLESRTKAGARKAPLTTGKKTVHHAEYESLSALPLGPVISIFADQG